ncbi:hypothetical protein D9M71_426120 [compost metagenome]
MVSALVITFTFGMLCSLRCSTASARSWLSNSISVTWATMPARSMAASTPELPPPITATRLPLNSGPSQCGQKHTPLALYSFSPGTPISRQRAPVARITDLAFSVAPPSNFTSCSSPGFFAGISCSARCRFMMSTSYCFTCSSSARASFGPSVSGTEMKFSMDMVSSTWPPKRSAATPVRMPLRAA